MTYTTLGGTGLEVSPLCIGSWQLGGPLSFDGKPDGHPDPGEDKVLAMIDALHERGINHIDTAEQYGGGGSERRVGKATSPRRAEWIISSKFGYRVGPNQTPDVPPWALTYLAVKLEPSYRQASTKK